MNLNIVHDRYNFYSFYGVKKKRSKQYNNSKHAVGFYVAKDVSLVISIKSKPCKNERKNHVEA